MPFQDRTLTCQDCGSPFTFSADDQQYHADRGFTNDPKRCPSCRARRREESGNGGGGGGGFGRREMTQVTCSSCGRETQVPFVPRGDRPVYCSDCFARERAGGQRRY